MFGKLLDPKLVASGYHSAYAEPQARTVRSATAWTKVADELGISMDRLSELRELRQPLHNMDWNSEMLVVVAVGMRPSGGFEIDWVRATTTASGESWKLTARLSAPGPDEAVTMAMTSPWAVYRLPAVPGEPSFFVETKTRGR